MELTIEELVLSRIPFITDYAAQIGNFVKEVSLTLKPFFLVKNLTFDIDDEATYAFSEKQMIAGIACILFLQKLMVTATAGTDVDGVAKDATILKKAKAGDAEAEFESVNKEGYSFGANIQNILGIVVRDMQDAFGNYPCSRYNKLLGLATDVLNEPFRLVTDA
jgi:hypothetical protein